MDVWSTPEPILEARAVLQQGSGRRLALVPTMGALHAGHLSLVAFAKAYADEVWASVFVNPTQFGPDEDFDRYPRTLDDDLAALKAAGVSGVFAPCVDVIYPPDAPAVAINVPTLTHDLEATHRPGHFDGVCRVVAKLLCLIQPDVAVFGRKDYQQWRVIEALAADLMMPTRILGAPTVYESDGLAMSSRNRYLTADERKRALGLSRALDDVEQRVAEGVTDILELEAGMEAIITKHGMTVDYATVRDRMTLRPLETLDRAAVALVLGRMGGVRLLDNREVAPLE